ncbi:T9SS type A sorting domain-containing protein [Ginsengibacter hankyongi]|uniref:T9SS type A sorting domain-containing protein n=1 Tax=Ginsengibacter hankyongi TaxID=2607284 RepID=A0A5J5IGC4_9BACT|nr:T9SS type A sorting domain-containing protein [Ginsengibacter hankyongi]KAA9038714.1 T9SS type A sorting domain-containing protein [Ginsengibacter hankyongi]
MPEKKGYLIIYTGMRKKLLINFIPLLFSTLILNAQVYTETFEGITGAGKPTTFTNNGQSFTAITVTPGGTLGGLFGVYIPSNTWIMPNPGGGSTTNTSGGFGVGTSCTSGSCTGVSDKFLDNGSSIGTGQVYSIKTTDNRLFNIISVHLFFSSDHGNTNVAPGSVIINGKKAGVTVFTINKVSGFITGFATNNGFNYINFATEGGSDFSKVAIDEIEFRCSSAVNYFAVDNFTWTPASVLPLQLVDFAGRIHDHQVFLSWHTAAEINTNHFELQWSNNSVNWQTINSQSAKCNNGAGNNVYAYTQNNPGDINFYRLRIVDNDGRITGSNVLRISERNSREIQFYPNPVSNKLLIILQKDEPAVVQFINSNGRLVKTMKLITTTTWVDIVNFVPGIYTMKIIQGAAIKEDKIVKL